MERTSVLIAVAAFLFGLFGGMFAIGQVTGTRCEQIEALELRMERVEDQIQRLYEQVWAN